MNFYLNPKQHRFRTDAEVAIRDTHEPLTDKLRFIFLELPSFSKEEDECTTDFERWIYVLKNMETLNRLPFKARKAVFEKLEQIVDISSMTVEERMKYDASINAYRTQLAVMANERNEGYAEGISKGREEGIKEGIKKGITQGREEGIKEGIKQTAASMKSKGFTSDQIAELTGLPKDEIENL